MGAPDARAIVPGFYVCATLSIIPPSHLFRLPHFVAALNVFMPLYVVLPYPVCLLRLRTLALKLAERKPVHVTVCVKAFLIALEGLAV